jgi:hypothetical protein
LFFLPITSPSILSTKALAPQNFFSRDNGLWLSNLKAHFKTRLSS